MHRLGAGLILFATSSAPASFHFSQIELVIGGVDGDSTAQAIQLRARAQFQCFFGNGAEMVVHDATGSNPVVVAVLDEDVAACGFGDRVLVATQALADLTVPPLAADFAMVTPIPAAYLAAGSLTFEDPFSGEVFWRLSWGDYTGDTTGDTFNDPDGEFGPPWPGPLPSMTRQGLRFDGGTTDLSTTNAEDYVATPGAAVFTNNACERFRLGPPCPWDCAPVPCQDVDNVVGTLDFLFLLSLWGTDDPGCDFDGGGVGVSDMLELLGHWGPCR